MQLSKQWIDDYLSRSVEVEELADRLTHSGHAVDGLEAVGDDWVLDLDITTNRPDCMNHLGMARDAAVLLDCDLVPPSSEVKAVDTSIDEVASLRVEDHSRCPSYTALVIRGVKLGPSPEWLVKRLETIGSRSINNIVDATNYVLWETGQPLHAFDLQRIAERQIIVRDAREGETLTTLDGAERKLDPSILIIADPQGPIALAGIMGGLDSEVTADTVDVLLECAHFDPTTVRKGAKKLGMKTDASHRYERGADPKACRWASRRAANLMVELAGGEILSGHLDATELRSDWPPVVNIEQAKLDRFGGAEIGAARTENILTRLGFEVEAKVVDDDTHFRVTVPSWRYYDFENAHPQDVYEEVLQVFGLDNIPSTLPAFGAPDGQTGAGHRRRRRVQDALASCGFTEAINFAFLDRESDASYPSFYADREPKALANPLSDLYSVMRRSLLPNLVESARYNQRRAATSVRLFEVGHIFAADPEQKRVEMDVAGLVIGGRLGSPWERQVDLDFYDLKGALEALAEALGHTFQWRPVESPHLKPGTGAELTLAARPDVTVGIAGQLAVDDLSYDLFVAEIALDRLDDGDGSLTTDTPSKFPGIAVDSTLTHSLDLPWSEIAVAIGEQDVEHLQGFALKDRYQGKGVPQGAVNTTIAFDYGSAERSLTQDEVNTIHTRLAALLAERFGQETS